MLRLSLSARTTQVFSPFHIIGSISDLLSFHRPRRANRFRARRHNFAVAHAPHHGLYQPLHALVLRIIRIEKPELRLATRGLVGLNGQLSAQVVFDERRFVARFFAIPCIHAQ